MEATLSTPRTLTATESSTLRSLLNSKLLSSTSNDDHIEDAENILDYAIDMIEGGDNIGNVVEEVSIVVSQKSVLCRYSCRTF